MNFTVVHLPKVTIYSRSFLKFHFSRRFDIFVNDWQLFLDTTCSFQVRASIPGFSFLSTFMRSVRGQAGSFTVSSSCVSWALFFVLLGDEVVWHSKYGGRRTNRHCYVNKCFTVTSSYVPWTLLHIFPTDDQ